MQLSANLANAMPDIVTAIRQVLGKRKFTLVFDRSGFDHKLFMWLDSQKHRVHHLAADDDRLEPTDGASGTSTSITVTVAGISATPVRSALKCRTFCR